MIEIDSHAQNDALIVPRGNLDWIAATELRHTVDYLLHLRLNFVIDLGRTNRVDASGLSAVVGSIRRARTVGINACVVNPRPSVRRQLGLVSIDHLVLCSKVDIGNDAA